MSDEATGNGHQLWIFGYGSLMWRPDFPFEERAVATIAGWHRAFCIASTVHRGNRRRPGLVLGLDRGGACRGVAYRIAASDEMAVLTYLRKRELIYGVYQESRIHATFGPGASRTDGQVLAYTVERRHPSYTGGLDLYRQAEIIRGAKGQSGANLDYLINTVRHLRELGIREQRLERLSTLAAGFAAHVGDSASLARPSVAGLRAVWSRQPARTHPLPLGDQRRFCYRVRLTR